MEGKFKKIQEMISKHKKRLLVIALITPFVLVAISGFRTNPKVERTVKWDSPQTQKFFKRACANCHSYETKWPWYSYVAPMSWMIIHNVNEARGKFNISAKKMGESDEAAAHVKEGEMPPFEYLLLHPEAKLTPKEKKAFIRGLKNTFGESDEEGEHEHHH